MNKPFFSVMVLSLLACTGVAQTRGASAALSSTGTSNIATQTITRAGTAASISAPAEFFTGRVRIDPVYPTNGEINASGSLVTFEPGARSAWHTHPKGQFLQVTAGVGLVQEWGRPVQTIRSGDVVWCPPGVKHWHGAGPTTAMTHLAVTGTKADGKNANWLEKVSDEQYAAP